MRAYTYKELKVVVRRCRNMRELKKVAWILWKFPEFFSQEVIDTTYDAIRVRRIFLKR